MTSALSGIMRHFNRWRLVLAIFLLVYAALLLINLDYTAIRWDETSHLHGGLLLSHGQFQEYILTESYYPPLFDMVTGVFFKILGASVFSARLVAVTFGVLSVWAVFEIAYRLYGPRTALVASVLLASMPGFIWLCRMALLETMLLFFFSISLLLFFLWMRTNNNKMLFLSGITLGIGVLVKYQTLVAGIIMLVSLLVMGRQRIVTKLGKFSFIVIIAAAVILPWFIFAYQQYSSGTLGTWLYALQVGNEERLAYSTRFPAPIFYLIEMTWPYPHVHPISLFVYIFTLLGLAFWLKRRRQEDKFLLISFFVVYSVFTLITSKDWRYITLVFPILAISGSEFILSLWDKAKNIMRAPHVSFRTKNFTKVAAAVLVLLASASVIYSSWETYLWLETDQVYVPIEEACQYVAERTTLNEKIVVLCAGNYFSADMVEFYLLLSNPNQEPPMQYPESAVDAYTPFFNVTWLIESSETLNVKYLLLYEHGNITFFQSELTSHDVLETMLNTNRFVDEKEFGSFPRQIFILRFLSNS